MNHLFSTKTPHIFQIVTRYPFICYVLPSPCQSEKVEVWDTGGFARVAVGAGIIVSMVEVEVGPNVSSAAVFQQSGGGVPA
jgi:hypothetical protein